MNGPFMTIRVYAVIRRYSEASMSHFVKPLDGILTQKQVRILIEGLGLTRRKNPHRLTATGAQLALVS